MIYLKTELNETSYNKNKTSQNKLNLKRIFLVMPTELITSIAAILVAALSSPIILLYIKKYLEKKKRTNIINIRIINDKIILDKLYYILYTTGACRAFVHQLHPEKLPMYLSCTHEVVRTGISKEIQNLQGLLLSEWNNLLITLRDKGYLCVEDVNDLNDDPQLQSLLINKGVKSTYVQVIKDSKNHIRGFVGIDYTNTNCTMQKEFVQLLTQQSIFLNKYLGEYNNV